MVMKKAKYALGAALVAMPLLAVQAADNRGLVYENAQDVATDSNPVTIANMGESDGGLIRVVRRGKPVTTVNDSELPVKVDADSMYYSSATGNVVAVGKVDAYQGSREIHSEKLLGNTKSQEYTTDGEFHYLENKGATKDLRGQDLVFNSGTNAMTAPDVIGYVEPYYVKAEKAEFDGNQGLITKGWVTTKHAMAYKGVPDYRIEGSTIEVYPGDKAIIHDAKLFIKNGKIMSTKKYVVSLRNDRQGQFSVFDLIPRPTYSSDDGFGLKGGLKYPVGDDGELFFRYQWMTKEGFKPSYGYRHYLPWGVATVGVSRESATLNARTVWVEKKPEFSVYTNVYHIGDTPFTVRGGATAGYWKEDYIKGSHYMYFGEVSHDTIKLAKNANLRFFAGYQRDYYGYNDHIRSMPYWGGNTNWRINSRVNVFAGYRQNNIDPKDNSPYPFDREDILHNFTVGASFRLTRLYTFTITTKRDVQSGELRYVDYTWHRDMHSFEGWLTYQSKQKKWSYTVVAKDF